MSEVSDDALLEAIKKVRGSNGSLGWKKVLQEVNKQQGWDVDLNRGKLLMKDHGFVAEVPPPRERKPIPPKMSGAETLASPAKKQKSGAGEPVSSINPFLQTKSVNPYLPAELAIDEKELRGAIERVKKDNPDFGVKRVTKVCQERWPELGQRRVKQIMKDLGMVEPGPQHANENMTDDGEDEDGSSFKAVTQQQQAAGKREAWEAQALQAIQKADSEAKE